MQAHTKLEMAVGGFVVVGLAALGYLSLSLGGVDLGRARYELRARFSSVGDLKRGDAVKLAGVPVGEVEQIALADYTAVVSLAIDKSVLLPRDSIASIQTAGLLGDAYVSLAPGAAAETLAGGESIRQTQSAISLTELIGKYAFGSVEGSSPPPRGARDGAGQPEDLLE